MKAIRPAQVGLFLSTLLLVLSLIVFLPSASYSAKNTTDSRIPGILIWIDARNPGGNSVSVTYPTLVAKSRAESDLHRLLTETKWNALSTQITNSSVMESGESPMTSIELTVTQTVDPQSGALPIEPIIKTFKDLKDIEILYLLPYRFTFRGPGDFENKYVKITLKRGVNTCVYSVQVKRSDFNELGIPMPQNPAQSSAKSGNLRLFVIVLVVILALLAAMLTYILTRRLANKN